MRVLLPLLVVAVGCDTNLGTLLSPKPCMPPDPACTPPVKPVCDLEGELSCGVGACARIVPACDGDVKNVCEPGSPTAESCNNLDDDCDGAIDEGCDDDGDQYCDDAFDVLGRPDVCPLIGIDCDDSNASRHPGALEVCEDGIDNDCNGFADFLDVNGCTHVTAAFQDNDADIPVLHGTTQTIRANITPPTEEIQRRWQVTGATPDADCSVYDVRIGSPEERPEATLRGVSIVDDPAKLSCRYQLTLYLNDQAADQVTVRMRNPRPRVNQIVGATLDGDELVMRLAAGTNPWITAVIPEDDDQPVTVQWAGPDADLLDCTGTCISDRMRFLQPLTVGTYQLRLRARDGFDPRVLTRRVRIEVVDCVWVSSGGGGLGSGPAQLDALSSIQDALNTPGVEDVCIAGGGVFDIDAPLLLPDGVGINGAFDDSGMPSDNHATVRLADGAYLGFEAGYAGALRQLNVRGGLGPLIVVQDAAPDLIGLELTVPSAPGARAISVESFNGPTSARVVSSVISATARLTDATGIEVVGTGPLASITWNGASAVRIFDCSGNCRGISIRGTAGGRLFGDDVEVEAFGEGSSATAIEVRGTPAGMATADIRDTRRISARTRSGAPADRTVSIQLEATSGVRIVDNLLIGPTYFNSGRHLSAGIADGQVRRDGSFDVGGSVDLRIAENRQIVAGRANYAWTVATCDDPIETREGTHVGVGLLLVGTSSATVERNGSNASRETAISGGASSAVWSGMGLAPAVPGVWTIDTDDVRLIRNEVRAGVLSTPADCPPMSPSNVSAVRDGLPDFMGSAGSRGLHLEGNGVITGRRGNFDPVPNIDVVGARLVEIFGGNTSSVYLVNNYVAATRGTSLVGVYAVGGEVALWNNVIELDVVTSSGAAVVKRGLLFEGYAEPKVDVVNNIVSVAANSVDAAGPVAMELRGVQPLRKLRHNLLFVEAAERNGDGAYVDADGERFDRMTFEDFAAQLDATANLILPPLFKRRGLEHRRSVTRLSARSPARDAGQAEGAPTVDRFGQPRPAAGAIDIGHHEFAP